MGRPMNFRDTPKLDSDKKVEPGVDECPGRPHHEMERHVRHVLDTEGRAVAAEDAMWCTHCEGWLYDWAGCNFTITLRHNTFRVTPIPTDDSVTTTREV